jgi:cellulase/cellobiase CelA1
MTEDLLKRAEPFLNQCGSCDAGLSAACNCPTGDYRPVMLDLVREVERLRKVASAYRHAAIDQHDMAGHFLDDTCEDCQIAAGEGESDLACDNYKRWQKSYSDSLGGIIEEVAW